MQTPERPDWLCAWQPPKPVTQVLLYAGPAVTLDEARAQGSKRYFTGKPCPHGHVAQRFVGDCHCCECGRLRNVTANKSEDERERHRERMRERYRLVAAMDGSSTANGSARRARLGRALPRWADAAAIKAVYAEAKRLEASTGVPHHVDHKVPLVGTMRINGKRVRVVCGLHVANNLHAVPGVENLRKRSDYDDQGWVLAPRLHGPV